MIKTAVILIFLLMMCPLSTAANAEQPLTVKRTDYFIVTLPPGFQMKKETPVEDFEIYTIYKDSQPYLFIYLGNQPNYPSQKPLPGSDFTELNVPPVKVLSEWKNGRLLRRELLATINEPNGWPSSLHAWTATLPEEKGSIADKILFSISIKSAN